MGGSMIRIAAQVSAYGDALGKGAARELNPRDSYRAWRRALLGGAGALALLAASSVAVNAQVVILDELIVPNVNQLNGNPNLNAITDSADALAVAPGPIVVFETAFASSTASATAIVRGPNPGDPVSVIQRNSTTIDNGSITRLNNNDQEFEANALAFSDSVDITNTLIGGNTTGLSSAVATATLNSIVNQRNDNLPGVVNNASRTQTGTQTNNNEQDFSSFSLADSEFVDIDSSGTVNTPVDGINADSVASATSHVGSAVTQLNENQLILSRTGNNERITETQTITQRNIIDQDFSATSLAFADDVIVTRNGATTAGGDGVDANSRSTAASDIASNNSQTNRNSLSGTTTGNPSGIIGAVLPFVAQDQNITQENDSEQESLAASIAAAGNVTVSVTGDTDAGLNGVNATSSAIATANNASTTTQSNDNAATATTSGAGAYIAQGPTVVNLPGSGNDLNCPGCGQDITQSNSHEALTAAASIAFAGDVDVTDTGYTTADSHGVNAQSLASATANANGSVTQTNRNSMSGTTTGGTGLLIVPAFVVQGQEVEQTNVNLEAVLAGSLAVSGDVTVTRDGDTDAGGDGINARSDATATATVDSSIVQSNQNSATATTTGDGAGVFQAPFSLTIVGLGLTATGGQDVDQSNINLQLLAAASLAASGDVTASNTGNTLADGNGINAISSATASADVGNGTTVTQTNTNSLSGTTGGEAAPVLQDQDADQTNLNGQLIISGAGAFSGDVNVTNSGDAETGGKAVNAASRRYRDRDASRYRQSDERQQRHRHGQWSLVGRYPRAGCRAAQPQCPAGCGCGRGGCR